MQVAGIGELEAWGVFWRLTYERCGHTICLPRTGARLVAGDELEAELRRDYAVCLDCVLSPLLLLRR